MNKFGLALFFSGSYAINYYEPIELVKFAATFHKTTQLVEFVVFLPPESFLGLVFGEDVQDTDTLMFRNYGSKNEYEIIDMYNLEKDRVNNLQNNKIEVFSDGTTKF
jgi:hypothetical protein